MGRILLIEFKDQDSSMFDEIMNALKSYPNIEYLRLNEESVLSLPGLEINLNRRKVYCNQNEIILTVKEYEILCLLGNNIGRVLTYEQIYQRVWGADALGNERKAVGFYVRNLRKKLFSPIPPPLLTIKSVREIGYRIVTNI